MLRHTPRLTPAASHSLVAHTLRSYQAALSLLRQTGAARQPVKGVRESRSERDIIEREGGG